MTFQEAFKIAQDSQSQEFVSAVNKITELEKNHGDGLALIFSVDGECFYYGWDGCEKIIKGKHTEKRSQWLLNHNRVLIIR